MLKTKGLPTRNTCLFLVFAWVFFSLPWATFARDYKKETEFFHRVSPGESLFKIAHLYLPLTEAYTVRDLIRRIRARNGLRGTLIRPNQYLVIPVVRSAPVVSKTIPKAKDFEARGIYLNRYSMACRKMPRLIKELTPLGGNTVVLDAKDMSGMLSYPSEVALAREIGASRSPCVDDLSKLFHFLHKRGLHVCVRIVLFCDPLLASRRPSLAIRSASTGEVWMEKGRFAWVDPFYPEVRRYNLDIAKELAALGADEIQFDYIRYPTMGNTRDYVFGFDPGKTTKHATITAFLAQAKEELAPYGVLLSIDVFGVMGWRRAEDIQMTGQNIEDLARYCDVISPMIYPSHFYGSFQGIADPGDKPFLLVSETCKRFSTLLRGTGVTIRPWIQAFPFGTRVFGRDYVLEELRALRRSRVRGWLLWSAANAYSTAWKALAEWNRSAPGREPPKARLSRLDGPHEE
ncbi:MAG: LysM peptidoglycan-binding domain-containing protein [Deltaproteobacteria bacterium]|nr:LysM peptidoglycan-binding domain-containing protein [Deltaproteobacteria bacterium]MBW2121762.1 LysM peptidoglycan-binding domain-containing protein [Deltaproteobacteria bacterium]